MFRHAAIGGSLKGGRNRIESAGDEVPAGETGFPIKVFGRMTKTFRRARQSLSTERSDEQADNFDRRQRRTEEKISRQNDKVKQ
jgi:hypothetical protein